MRHESTHDWTSTIPDPLAPNEELNETWVDAKSPGDGRTYMVGTIEVRDTELSSNPTFSNEPVELPPQTAGSNMEFLFEQTGGQPAKKKQVVIVQCLGANGDILWQRYFYGWTSGLLTPDAQYRRHNCARAISVWAGATPEETRIAICGETQDDVLPLSQAPLGWPLGSPTQAPGSYTGFIAVYRGDGELSWTHHFFGDPAGAETEAELPDCAITDVSIRTQLVGEQLRDVVTYCGISTHGLPTLLGPLSPRLAFSTTTACSTTSGGASDFGRFQWDGIVGRVSNAHAAPDPLSTEQEFHSIVGGPGQDGLFGIAELEHERFVAVGGSSVLTTSTGLRFPFLRVCGIADPHRVGAVLVFDASDTRLATPGALRLETCEPLGATGPMDVEGTLYSTIARDVLVQFDTVVESSVNPPFEFKAALVHVVGATNDDHLFAPLPGQPAFAGNPGQQMDQLQGASDGFLSTYIDNGPGLSVFLPWGGGFVGGSGDDGLTGISSWSEHHAHTHVCGYSVLEGNVDILVATVFQNFAYHDYQIDSTGITYVPATDPTILIRSTTIGGSDEDRPTALGLFHATALQSTYGGRPFTTGLELVPTTNSTDDVGLASGGGIAVDPRGRATVGGRTRGPNASTGFPVSDVPFLSGRDYVGSDDAVRVDLDMLPAGVSRTDGTGSRFDTFYPVVPAPPPPTGFTGGTTPPCALSQFGRRVGEDPPFLPRMLVEFEGINDVGETPSILFTRPPSGGTFLATALQYGFPTSTPPGPFPGVIEYWMDSSAAVVLVPYPGWGPGYENVGSWRFQFTVPLGDPSIPAPWQTMPITAQLVVLSTCDVTTWPCANCDSSGFTYVASPALTFEF